MEVSKDCLSSVMMVRSELAKEIQIIKSSWTPKQDKDNDNDKDEKGKGQWRKRCDGVHEDTAVENIPTNDTPQRSPCSQAPELGRSQNGAVLNDWPSTSGVIDSPGTPPSGDEKELQWFGEGECWRANCLGRISMSNQGPR